MDATTVLAAILRDARNGALLRMRMEWLHDRSEPRVAIACASSRHGPIDQLPDAAPEGEGSTNTLGKPSSAG
jgi:hypothetical protein